MMRLPFTEHVLMYHVTHKLLIMAREVMRVMRLLFTKCHSLPVAHRKRCDKTVFYKLCNVTHRLLVIGKM